jgi:hypothetical protein
MGEQIMNVENVQDPIWEYVLHTRLSPYIPVVRDFWEHIADVKVVTTGVYVIENEEVPGLMYRVTNTPVRSPIKNVQVFPFVPTGYLQITSVPGGTMRMVSRICADNRFKIDEFTIVEKSNLPSTYHQGQILAFIPTALLEGTQKLGKWVYLTVPEMISLSTDTVTPAIKSKISKYIV